MDPEIPFVNLFNDTYAQNIDNELVFSIKLVKEANDLWSLHLVKNVSYMFAGSVALRLNNYSFDNVAMPYIDYTTIPLYSTLDYTVEEPPTLDTIYSTYADNTTAYKRFGEYAFSKEGKITFTASLPEDEQPLAVYFGFSNLSSSDFNSSEFIENYTNKVVIEGTDKKTYTVPVPANGKSYTRLYLLLEKPRSGNGKVYIDDIRCLNDNATEETYKKQMSFNQDISSWDVSNVENFQGMFKDNTAFDGNGSNLMDNWLIKKD
jgi:hypothetical protein